MDWAQILVIILAVFFGVFLLLAIILAILLIKITTQIKAAAASAERTVTALESAATGFNRAALPLSAVRMVVGQLAKTASNRRKGGGNE